LKGDHFPIQHDGNQNSGLWFLSCLWFHDRVLAEDTPLIDFKTDGAEKRIKPNGDEGVEFAIVDGAKGKALQVKCVRPERIPGRGDQSEWSEVGPC